MDAELVVLSFVGAAGVGLVLVLVRVMLAQYAEGLARRDALAKRDGSAELERRQREQRRQSEEKERIRGEVTRKEQEAYRHEAIELSKRSVALFESVADGLARAECHLDQAEIDFAQRGFAPFWDAIEQSAAALAHVDEGARHINAQASRYLELIRKYRGGVLPAFPLASDSIRRLEVARRTADRMGGVVREAQHDFQFAVIYEQRKTNRILVTGFTTLANILESMTSQLTSSIADLTGSVQAISPELKDIERRLTRIADGTAHHHTQLAQALSEQAARERKAVAILDNIQRGRRSLL